ncbi:MAG TPA: biotin carboxylase N-terminal domain-containing protein [Vicinamibacterales bacterium]|nr:biotin carboxylase N-terminal domain-containing protein [Vicinamibacterales bacterium]
MNKILIANRGEIAVRIIRTCRDMGLATVAVYSDCDRSALHVRLADEAHHIGPDQASESYLRIDKVIDVARSSGAGGVHPGYGFLAENPELAEACAKARLTFIGPSPAAMRAMGSKTQARQVAIAAGVPVVPGGDTSLELEYPMLVKAVAGGGGKGMRVVRSPDELQSAISLARSEAQSSFGNDAVYFEKLIERPRHIEVQLLGDTHGTVVPFVERECSIQRRHQKLIEETPSPSVTPELRKRLLAAAAAIGKAANYMSAGTVEFLVDASGEFYFLEMNTRLQVEHPITEAVTGIDFVRAQIEVARGAMLSEMFAGRNSAGFDSARLDSARLDAARLDAARLETSVGLATPVGLDFSRATGHAIEVRVYAENPAEGFLPSPGRITHLQAPSGPGIRDDSGAYDGWIVPTAYDPLISKVVAWAPDRPGAIARMVGALGEYDVRGISTTIGFCGSLIASPAFAAAEFDTTFVDRLLGENGKTDGKIDGSEEIVAIAAAIWAALHAEPAEPIKQPEPELGTGTRNLEPGTGNLEPGTRNPERGTRNPESLWAQRGRLDGLR